MAHTVSKKSLDRLANCKPEGLFVVVEPEILAHLVTMAKGFDISDEVLKNGLIW